MLSSTVVEWGALALHGSRAPGREVWIQPGGLTGWEGFSGRDTTSERDMRHGAFDGPVLAGARRVMVQGRASSPEARDEVLAELAETFVLPSTPVGSPLADLRVTHAGRTLTAPARLLRWSPAATYWGAGFFDWAAEWVCPDPWRYGDPVDVSTPFARDRSGLRFPLFTDGAGTETGVLTFGDPGDDTGHAAITNDGSADAWPVFRVAGPVLPAGFEIVTVETGARLQFVGPVAAGSTLTIRPDLPLVVLDGSDRMTSMTLRDWAPVPPRSTRTFHFRPLGGDSTAVLSVELSPTYW
ncbi:hypothetical protein [Cellulomonas sp. ES6]|uniref:hypothetical protein n=1 Tax=Cellulomonas sp. ES6 TaxID=3039384 RepID=UPI0024B6AA0F|nr:hypothetical protein [Cellulomonas sp. ES6]WHP18843.1 hypothetical protein P9841_06920 [Cellulomonas sp. ES6]